VALFNAPDSESLARNSFSKDIWKVDRLDRLDHATERARRAQLRSAPRRCSSTGSPRRWSGRASEPFQAGEPVEFGHPQVEQDDIRLRLTRGRNDLAADETSPTISKSTASASAAALRPA
jgi:hypothetical protein